MVLNIVADFLLFFIWGGAKLGIHIGWDTSLPNFEITCKYQRLVLRFGTSTAGPYSPDVVSKFVLPQTRNWVHSHLFYEKLVNFLPTITLIWTMKFNTMLIFMNRGEGIGSMRKCGHCKSSYPTVIRLEIWFSKSPLVLLCVSSQFSLGFLNVEPLYQNASTEIWYSNKCELLIPLFLYFAYSSCVPFVGGQSFNARWGNWVSQNTSAASTGKYYLHACLRGIIWSLNFLSPWSCRSGLLAWQSKS